MSTISLVLSLQALGLSAGSYPVWNLLASNSKHFWAGDRVLVHSVRSILLLGRLAPRGPGNMVYKLMDKITLMQYEGPSAIPETSL